MRRKIAFLAVVASTLLLMGLVAGPALAAGDDDIPGIPVGAGTITGVVDETTDPHDVYCVQLFEGEAMHLHLTTANASEWGAHAWAELIPPGVTSINNSYTALAFVTTHGANPVPDDDYTPAKDGIYYLRVDASGGGVTYSLTISGSAEKPPNPAYLRLRTSATKVSKGHSVTLTAKLVDADSTLIPNYSVDLFRSNDGHAWTKMTTLSSTTGDYAKKVRITRKTWFKMRFAGDATWSVCTSRVVTVSLR